MLFKACYQVIRVSVVELLEIIERGKKVVALVRA